MTTEPDDIKELDVSLDVEVPAEVPSEPAVTNEDLLALRQQIADANRQREAAERRAQAAEASRDQESAGRVSESSRRLAAQETAIVNAIAAKTAETERLAEQAAALMEEGKFLEAARLNQKGGRIESEIAQLESYKGQLAQEKTRADEAAKAPPRNADPYAHLSPKSAEWAREHPEYFADQKLHRKAVAADAAARADDIEPDTPAYFDYINRHLGLVKDAEPAPAAQPAPKPRASAAPVSRSVPESPTNPNRTIRLTPEQQEVARLTFSKMPEQEAYKLYAKNLSDLRREERIS